MKRSSIGLKWGVKHHEKTKTRNIRSLRNGIRLHERQRQRPSGLARRFGRRGSQREVVMKAAVLRTPGGLDRIEVHDIPDPGQPGPGQIRIALHASSLNSKDLLVAKGGLPTADRRILMSDGAGVVEAVGEGVAEFRPGDHVVSCFFPQLQDGLPSGPVCNLASTPGDGIDGFAAHFSVRAATAFTHAPRGWSHAEAATITTAGVTAWRALVGDGQIKTGDTVLVLGTGGVSIAALQIAKMMGAAVIATPSSCGKLGRGRTPRAHHVIKYRPIPHLGERVRGLTTARVVHVMCG